MKYGYARVSTDDQSTALQLAALKRAGCKTLFKDEGLSGTLTCYPVDTGVYDWALQNSFFKPKNEEQQAAKFIQKFSSASQEHFHYEDGALA